MTTNLVHRKALFTGTTDGSNCDSLPAKAAVVLGGLDIVVNNAGVIRRGAITEATYEEASAAVAAGWVEPAADPADCHATGLHGRPLDQAVGASALGSTGPGSR